jgi:hypothetical protein
MAFVAGMVTDGASGEPIENATVIIGIDWALSDDKGSFTIAAPIKPGNYTLKVLQRNYIPLMKETTIDGDCNIEVSLFAE